MDEQPSGATPVTNPMPPQSALPEPMPSAPMPPQPIVGGPMPPSQPLQTQPTPGIPGQPYISNPFDLFSPSWQALKLNFGTWFLLVLAVIGVELLFFLIPFGIFLGAGLAHQMVLTIIALIAGLLSLIGFIVFVVARFVGSFTVLALASVRGRHMELKEALTEGQPFGWRLIGFTAVYVFMLLLGFLLFIIPGILILVWYGFTPYVIVDENLSIGAAMSRSKQLVQGRFWEVYSVYSLPFLFSLLEIIPLVGAIAAFVLQVIYWLASPIRYAMLKAYRDDNAQLPPVNSVNYVVPVAQAVVIIITIVLFVIFSFSFMHSFNRVFSGNHKPIVVGQSTTLPNFSTSNDNSTGQSTTTAPATSTSLAPGEQLSHPPDRRPPQYVHQCGDSSNIYYVSQGSPNCLPGDTFQFDYGPSAARTAYSVPCETTSGSSLRYIYVSSAETCPSGTAAVN